MNTKLLVLLLVIFLFLFNYHCYSSPIIESGLVTKITGSGFGTDLSVTNLILWDDFEDGLNGSNLNVSPKIGSWEIIGSGDALAKYSTSYYHSGKQSSIGTATTAHISSQFLAPPTGHMTSQYYYIYYWFRYDNTDDLILAKIVQLWGTYGIGDYNPGFFSTIAINYLNNPVYRQIQYVALENTGATNQTNILGPAPNQWHLVELILKQSTVNIADGSITMKVDGVAVYDKQNIKTRELDGQSWDHNSFFYGYYGGQIGTIKSTIIDDVYMSDTWSRLMIGNNPIFNNCTHLEIQIPTSWSDTEISFTFNQGSFVAGDQAYLFVIDSDGNASEGYPITIPGTSLNTTGTLEYSGSLTME